MAELKHVHYESLSRDTGSDTIHPDLPQENETQQDAISESEAIIIFEYKFIKVTLSGLRYFTYLFIGISLLWPWNCFLSASAYFIDKFGTGSVLSNNYSSTMMTVSTLTSLIFNSYLSTKQDANLNTRIKIGSLINFIVFTVLAILEEFLPSLHNTLYFVLIMGLVFASSLGTCLQQNSCMSKVNLLGPKYAQAVMVGQAIAGVFPSISLILTNLLYDSDGTSQSTTSIVLYFGTTSIITLCAYLLLSLVNRFDKELDIPIDSGSNEDDLENELQKEEFVPFMRLFGKLKYIVLSIVIVFLVTLSFAIFASNIASVHHWGRFTSNSIFVPFVFLIWNIGDLSGRIICAFPQVVLDSDLKIFIYSIARFLILPLFFLCNLDRVKGKPIVNSDAFYILLQFIFGLTNGHCLSCCFMNIGKYVDESEKKAAGGFSTVFLSLGLLFGSLFSYAIVFLVN